jgi:hypothetical protein
MTDTVDEQGIPGFKHVSLGYYTSICRDGRYSIDLQTEEAAVVLKAYDYGILVLDEQEIQLLNSMLGKLKDQIWP